MNDSTAPGYLAPAAAPGPLVGDALSKFFHDLLEGVSGLRGDLVIPGWQTEPPAFLSADETWIAYRIVNQARDWNAAIEHDGALEVDHFQRHEVLDVFIVCYGPRASEVMGVLSDGLQIEQNLDALRAEGMGFVSASDLINAPLLLKERWRDRVDMTFRVKRSIVRDYPVRSIAEAIVDIDNEKYHTTVDVTQ